MVTGQGVQPGGAPDRNRAAVRAPASAAGALSVHGAGEAAVFPPDRPVVVGRSMACDLVISDGRVSRRHVMLEPSADGWFAVDISQNGTWVAGDRRVQRVRVADECRLRLGAADGPELVLAPVRAPAGPGVARPPAGPAAPRPRAAPAPPQPAAPAPDAASAADRHFERPTYIPRDGDPAGPILPPGAEASTAAGDTRRAHRIDLGRVTIGRFKDNDIVVGDLLASREHAELLVGRAGIQINDLGSANGTFVNGRRVEHATVGQGDVIAIGHHVFHVGDGVLLEHVDDGDVAFEVDGLSVDAGSTRLLHDVTFRLPGRTMLAVLGPSGAGKSTLLNALTGFRPANVGSVRYAGRNLYDEYDELRRRIGYVPQDDILHTSLTVRQALEYGAKLRFPAETTEQERRARVDEVLTELALTNRAPGEQPTGKKDSGDLSERQVSKLSGGQRKRTSVALELLTQPTLLYLDEPTSGLDPGMDKEVMVSLRRLADGGRTVIVVTHSVAQLQLCDYLLVLAKGGQVAYFGPPQHALEFFGEADWADAFRVLQTTDGANALAQRYRSSEFHVRGSASAPMVHANPPQLQRIRQQSVLSQTVTLSRRYLRVIASDRAYLRILVAYPIVLGVIPQAIRTPHGFGPAPAGAPPNLDAARALLVVILMACFMGSSNAIRELVKEREIYRRERAIGLSTVAYLGSKVIVLSLITGLQSAVLTLIGLAGRFPPHGVILAHGAWLEMVVAVAGTAIASAMVGLALSALVDNADKTMPPLVVLVMAQLVFTGALFPLAGTLVLEQISWIFPGRWGYAATASVVDLNTLQNAHAAQHPPGITADGLWDHTVSAYATDLGGIAVLGLLSLLLTSLFLRRLDPRRG